MTTNPDRSERLMTRPTVLTAPKTFSTTSASPVRPGEQDAVVRVHETGLCGSDVTMYLGKHPVNQPPLTLGHEFYGELLTAPQSSHAEPGDVVAVFPALSCGRCAACRTGKTNLCHDMGIIGAQRPGALAGVVAVPATSVRIIDPAAPAGLRVLIEPLAVALHAVNRAGPVTGQRCAVLGAGTIGMLVALVLQERGVEVCHVVDTNPDKLGLVDLLEAGTAHLADDAPLSSTLGDVYGELDTVFDCVGSAGLVRAAVPAVHPGGTIVLVGVQHGELGIDGPALQRGERSLFGVQLYTMDEFDEAIGLLTHQPRFRGLPAETLIRRNPVQDVSAVFDRLSGATSAHLKETIVFS